MSEMEDEYDDELPPISVSTSQDESVFAMPSAEVLATQRAREEQCERQLLQLKARHEAHEQQEASRTAVNGGPAMPLRSDSSGSETETVLASAVELITVQALRVGSSVGGGGPRAAARALLAAALPRLPRPARPARALAQHYLDALRRGSAGDVDALTDDILTGIGSWVCGLTAETATVGSAAAPGERAPADDEVLGVGTWLCAAVLWRAPRQQRARATRALHALLAAASKDQVRSLSRLAALSWRSAALRGELSAAAAAAGAEPRAAQFAAALARAALADLLDDPRPADLLDDPRPADLLVDPRPADLLDDPRPADLLDDPRPADLLDDPRPADLLDDPRPADLLDDPRPADLLDDPRPAHFPEDLRPAPDAQPDMPLSMSELAALAARGWRGVPPAERDAAVQLLGRALAAAKRASGTSGASTPSDYDDQAALARALAALAQPLSHTQADRHRPDFLKIAVAASKLQILLSDRK